MITYDMDDDDFVDRVECWKCQGLGKTPGCFEDTCSCLGDPDDAEECCAPNRCDVCGGKGWWPREPEDGGQ